MAQPLLSKTQRKELVSQLVTGGVRRTTVGPLTTEFSPPTVSDILKVLEEDQAAAAPRVRPWILQRHRSPGAIY